MPQPTVHHATRRQAAVGVAVLVAAVVAVPLLLSLSSFGPGRPSAPASARATSAHPSPARVTAVTPPIGSAVPSIAWVDVAASGLKGVDFVGAAQTGDTLVVAGNTADAGSGATSPVIAYYEGSTWKTVEDKTAFADSRIDWLLGVPGGLAAIGESTLPDPRCPVGGDDAGCVAVAPALVWTSVDGVSWTRLSGDAVAPFDRVWVVAAASGPEGAAVYGVRMPASYASGSADESVILTSADGRSWTAGKPSGVESDPADVFWAQRVAYTGSGLVVTGTAGRAWTSPDGMAWTAASVPDGGVEAWPARDVAVASGGMVSASQGWMVAASGNPGFDLGPVWRSADGSSWATSEWPTQGAPMVFAGDGSRIAATGPDGSGVWWSYDGSTWAEGTASGAIPAPDALTKAMPGVWLLRSWIVVGGASCLYVGTITG